MACALASDGTAQLATTRLYTTADGLTDHRLADVHRDANGFLWILGQQGIQRFDGHRFEDLNRLVPDILQESLFNTPGFHVDPEGWVWLVERNGHHALRFDPLTERTEVKDGPIVLPTAPDLRRICPRLFPFYDVMQPHGSPKEVHQRVRDLAGPFRLRAIQCTSDGRLWLYRNGQSIVPFHSGTGSANMPRSPDRARDQAIALGIDPRGVLSVPGSYGGVQRIQLPASMLDREADFFDLDDAGGCWLVDRHHGLWHVDLHTGVTTDLGQQARGMGRVYRDPEGIVWLCTDLGLLQLREPLPSFTPIGAQPLGLRPLGGPFAGQGRSMRGLVEGPGGSFLAFSDSGEMLRVDASGVVTPLRAELPNGTTTSVQGMCRAVNGTVWIISNGLLHAFEGDGPVLKPGRAPDSAFISSIHATRTGDRFILFLNDDQAVLFDPVAERFGKPFPLAKEQRAEVLLTAQRLYLPDAKGLRVVELGSKHVRTVDLHLSEPLRESGVRGIVAAGHMLHLATRNGVLSVDTVTWRVVRHTNEADGLADPVVYSLLSDGDRLWAGTRNGLSLVDPATGQCINFHMADGLPFDEFNTGPTLLDSGGRCWMGGVNGLVYFDPGEVSALPRNAAHLLPVRLRISDDRATTWTEHRSDLSQGITMQPHERTLSIVFALSKLADPGAHRFSYYLEGLEPPWFNTGDRTEVFYHGLTPGKYRFRAKAFDHRGVAALNELDIPITVMQVWYLRKWAIALWVATGILATYLLVREVMRRRAERAEALRILELDAFKDRFFANVTHEFRTPITVIQGLAGQLGEDTTASKEAQAKATVIQRNGQRLLGLVDQVLDLTRLEHGRLELDPRPGYLQGFLRRVLMAHDSLASVRGSQLEVEVAGDDVPVLYDAERLRQIADNLVSNALKFTPPGGTVTVRATLSAGVRCNMVLEVRDTGPGIAEVDLPRIFDRFFQSEGHDRIASGGTGIGLALVKELVDAMGGRVRVESELGKGACFTVELSLELAGPGQMAEQADVKPPPPPTYTAAPVFREKATSDDRPVLLVVEDDPDVGDYIVDLVQADHHVLRAMDGTQGLALAQEHVPDLILSDVMMPGRSGFELCHMLKSDPRTSHIPLALLTARSDQPSRVEGLTRGADAYLVKPFDEAELRLVLRNLIQLQRAIQVRYQRAWDQTERPASGTDAPSKDTSGLDRTELLPADIEHTFLARIRDVMEAHYTDPEYSVEQLADALHLSRSQVFRKIKALTGRSPVLLLRAYRLNKARTLLERGGATVAEVAYDCGFSSPNYFSDAFMKEFGQRPSEVLKA